MAVVFNRSSADRIAAAVKAFERGEVSTAGSPRDALGGVSSGGLLFLWLRVDTENTDTLSCTDTVNSVSYTVAKPIRFRGFVGSTTEGGEAVEIVPPYTSESETTHIIAVKPKNGTDVEGVDWIDYQASGRELGIRCPRDLMNEGGP